MIAARRGPFAFAVPPELEATLPPEYRGIPRDHVQMLVTERASGNAGHANFVDLAAFLRTGDIVVANDSATIPAALDGHREGGEPLTLHLSAPVSSGVWVVEPRGLVRPSECIALPAGGAATFLGPLAEEHSRLWYARIDLPEPLDEYLAAEGRAIRYRYVRGDVPIEAYQTIFARVPGSVEMPSAGRPFTQRVLDDLARRGVDIVCITLHCGVASAEVHEPPQPERFAVGASAATRINRARAQGGRVLAVGTSVVRALESSVDRGCVVAGAGWTNLVIGPEHAVRAADGLLTGMHEPQASHLEMMQAFLKDGDLAVAYEEALAHRYLWHEFGDVHLIL